MAQTPSVGCFICTPICRTDIMGVIWGLCRLLLLFNWSCCPRDPVVPSQKVPLDPTMAPTCLSVSVLTVPEVRYENGSLGLAVV